MVLMDVCTALIAFPFLFLQSGLLLLPFDLDDFSRIVVVVELRFGWVFRALFRCESLSTALLIARLGDFVSVGVAVELSAVVLVGLPVAGASIVSGLFILAPKLFTLQKDGISVGTWMRPIAVRIMGATEEIACWNA